MPDLSVPMLTAGYGMQYLYKVYYNKYFLVPINS